MTPLISTRRVEEFANAADGRAPARRADVRGLVEVVEAIRAVEHPIPGTDFVSNLRASLIARAEFELTPPIRAALPTQPTVRRVPPVSAPLGRRFAVAASAFVVAGGGVGLVATSASALPGEMLYPVKRATERVDLLLHTDSGDDARILLGHAETRLDEVAALLAAGDTAPDTGQLGIETLEDFTDEATEGGQILLSSYAQTGSTDDIEYLRSFTSRAASQLQLLAAALPPSTSEAYAEAAAAVGALDAEAVIACPTCRGGAPAVDPAVDALSTAARQLPRFTALPRLTQVQQPAAQRPGRRTDQTDSGTAGDDGGSTKQPDGSAPEPAFEEPGTGLPTIDPDPSVEPPDATNDPQPPQVTASADSPVEVVEELVTGASGGSGGGSTEPSAEPTDILDPSILPEPLTDPLAD